MTSLISRLVRSPKNEPSHSQGDQLKKLSARGSQIFPASGRVPIRAELFAATCVAAYGSRSMSRQERGVVAEDIQVAISYLKDQSFLTCADSATQIIKMISIGAADPGNQAAQLTELGKQLTARIEAMPDHERLFKVEAIAKISRTMQTEIITALKALPDHGNRADGLRALQSAVSRWDNGGAIHELENADLPAIKKLETNECKAACEAAVAKISALNSPPEKKIVLLLRLADSLKGRKVQADEQSANQAMVTDTLQSAIVPATRAFASEVTGDDADTFKARAWELQLHLWDQTDLSAVKAGDTEPCRAAAQAFAAKVNSLDDSADEKIKALLHLGNQLIARNGHGTAQQIMQDKAMVSDTVTDTVIRSIEYRMSEFSDPAKAKIEALLWPLRLAAIVRRRSSTAVQGSRRSTVSSSTTSARNDQKPGSAGAEAEAQALEEVRSGISAIELTPLNECRKASYAVIEAIRSLTSSVADKLGNLVSLAQALFKRPEAQTPGSESALALANVMESTVNEAIWRLYEESPEEDPAIFEDAFALVPLAKLSTPAAAEHAFKPTPRQPLHVEIPRDSDVDMNRATPTAQLSDAARLEANLSAEVESLEEAATRLPDDPDACAQACAYLVERIQQLDGLPVNEAQDTQFDLLRRLAYGLIDRIDPVGTGREPLPAERTMVSDALQDLVLKAMQELDIPPDGYMRQAVRNIQGWSAWIAGTLPVDSVWESSIQQVVTGVAAGDNPLELINQPMGHDAEAIGLKTPTQQFDYFTRVCERLVRHVQDAIDRAPKTYAGVAPNEVGHIINALSAFIPAMEKLTKANNDSDLVRIRNLKASLEWSRGVAELASRMAAARAADAREASPA